MKTKYFNKNLYNAKKLKPKAEDIELNKCMHIVEDSNECLICGTIVNRILDINELIDHSNNIINYLETMKMIAGYAFSKKELKTAQKYFDMIPLLKNINSLYDICNEYMEEAYPNELNENFNVTKECDDNGNLIYFCDHNTGFEAWYEYDDYNFIIHYKDSNGYEKWWERDEKGKVLSYKDNKEGGEK